MYLFLRSFSSTSFALQSSGPDCVEPLVPGGAILLLMLLHVFLLSPTHFFLRWVQEGPVLPGLRLPPIGADGASGLAVALPPGTDGAAPPVVTDVALGLLQIKAVPTLWWLFLLV